MCCLNFISKLLAGSKGAMFLLACYCMGSQIKNFCTGTKTGHMGGKKTMARKPLIYKKLRAIAHWMRREG